MPLLFIITLKLIFHYKIGAYQGISIFAPSLSKYLVAIYFPMFYVTIKS